MGEKNNKKVKRAHIPYTNRELSWLAFNERVLEEAYEKENPLLERLKFLSITASNLDEFFMVRVAGLREQARMGVKKPYPIGQSPAAQLRQISEQAHFLCQKQYNCLRHSLLPMLRKQDILLVHFNELDAKQKKQIARYFEHTIFPVLTPLAVDQSRPFPLLANRSLNLAVRLKKGKETHFAVVQVPSILPRFIAVPNEKKQSFILLEEVIIAYLPKLLETHEVKAVSLFRITRNADLSIDEEAEDLLQEIQKSIKKRKRGRPVRLEIHTKCDEETRRFLIGALDVREADVYPCAGPLDLTAWSKLASMVKGHAALRLAPVMPAFPADFFGCEEDLFAAIRARDRFVHHPYESFGCVIKFLADAAEDPNVLAIKQTLYRVSGNSPIVRALMRAAENGKQVTVLVELKARFDEENNIGWSKKMEEAGVKIIYGLDALKVHSKLLLITRKQGSNIRYYTQIGTGNYNEKTSRLYTDLTLMTSDKDIGADASTVFNALSLGTTVESSTTLLVAPKCLKSRIVEMIDNEITYGTNGYIGLKMNSLTDKDIIDKLIEASCQGVKIELIIRGICCLIAGVPGYTENISVISIVGRFLEHSRIYIFGKGERRKVYISSADFMTRNTERRVEVAVPLKDKIIADKAVDIFNTMLKDNVKARVQGSDGIYRHKRAMPGEERTEVHKLFYERAYQEAEQAQKLYKEPRKSLFARIRARLQSK